MEIKIKAKTFKLIAISITGFVLVIILIILLLNRANQKYVPFVSAENCLPAFADGGGPYYLPDQPFRTDIAPENHQGERLVVEGYILNTNCTDVVGNLVLDVWQASEEGEYEDEFYRGQIRIGEDGYYKFETVLPKGYGEGTAYRPPHIHFKVWNGETEISRSQMFFSDVTDREGFSNQYIIKTSKEGDTTYGEYNIILP